MNRPFKLNLMVFAGATFREQLTWKAGEPPVPVDLTNCSARAQFRAKVDAPTALHTMTSEAGGGIVLGGAAGTIELAIPANVTEAFKWKTAVWDFELVFSSGEVRRLFEGRVDVSPEATRV